MKQTVAVIFTGGTISMKVDARIKAAIPSMSSEDIMSMVTNIDQMAALDIVEFGALPGPHMTPEKMMELKRLVQSKLNEDEICGVVITHGTDNLEETAYLMDLCISHVKPVVFVGSMRNGSELGYDGPSNLAAAICTAIHPNSKNKGVLVVLNNEVNAAREVTKTHTLALDTFKSQEFGPLGIVDQDDVIFYHKNSMPTVHIETDEIESDVHLIKTAAGMDSMILNFLVEKGVKGIVIEGMGRGNVPPLMMEGIRHALEAKIPVVLVSRCPMGRVLGSYGYDGGGKQLEDLGVIFASNLNGQKARIQLMLAITAATNFEDIATYFQD
ncbi:MAG TPA: L-asparaginase [Firmicutes bacterium]|nr:L-asparaginase [Bacillota bacterium]